MRSHCRAAETLEQCSGRDDPSRDDPSRDDLSHDDPGHDDSARDDSNPRVTYYSLVEHQNLNAAICLTRSIGRFIDCRPVLAVACHVEFARRYA